VPEGPVQSSEQRETASSFEEAPLEQIKYADFLEGLGAGLLALDLEGRFLFLNSRALAMFGYGSSESSALVGQHFTKILTAEQAEVAQQLFSESKEIRPVVLNATRKDGSTVTVEVSGAWVRKLGRRVGALAMAWDVSGAQTGTEQTDVSAHTDVSGLSQLDMTILKLVSEGRSNREIADRVYLSRHTVKDRIEKLMRVFGASRRAELAAKAARQGLA
jgi:PAS domain S-box-containing protein